MISDKYLSVTSLANLVETDCKYFLACFIKPNCIIRDSEGLVMGVQIQKLFELDLSRVDFIGIIYTVRPIRMKLKP